MNRLYPSIILLPILLGLSTYASPPPANLYVGVFTDKPVYRSGEPISMALTVLNKNKTLCKVTFTSSQKFDFYLYKDDRLTWKWSTDKMFSMAISALKLEPEKPLTFLVTSNHFAPGKGLDPGIYQIKASFCTKDQEFFSEPEEIEIRK
jgi:hypothetical protein